MPSAALLAGGTISAVQIQGNVRAERETIRSYLQLKEGQPYDAAAADRSLKALFGTGLFSDVVIEMQGSTLVVKVTENPIINRVAFEGNSKIDDDKLRDEVQSRAAPGLHARARAVRRRAHPHHLSPRRPLQRIGRAQDHQARAGPRRSRLRDQRRRRDRHQAHQLRRQRGIQRRHAARQDPDRGERLVALPVVGRPLRSRIASISIANCCASSTSPRAMPISASCRRSPNCRPTGTGSSSPSRSARASATSSARSTSRPASRGSMSTS